MMETICLIVMFILLCGAIIIYHSFFHPVVLFNTIWAVLTTFSYIGVLNLNVPSEKVYFLSLLGYIGFNIGALITNIKRGKLTIESSSDTSIKVDFVDWCPPNTYYAIVFIEAVLLFYFGGKAINLVGNLSSGMLYGDIRSYYYSENFTSSVVEYFALYYIFDPLLLMTKILFSVNLFNRVFKTPLTTLMLINILLRTFISGGRMVIFEFAIILVFSYLSFRHIKHINQGKTIAIIGVIGVLAIIGVSISTQRNASGNFFEKMWKITMQNFTGSFPYFDSLLENDRFPKNTYGLVPFAGFIDPIITALKFAGLTNISTNQILVGNITSSFVYIGGGYSYNAMPTMLYYFYIDYSYFGVAFFPLLFGWLSTNIYKRLSNITSIRAFILYIIMVITIVESPMTWLLFYPSNFLTIVYVYFLFRRTGE